MVRDLPHGPSLRIQSGLTLAYAVQVGYAASGTLPWIRMTGQYRW